MNEHEPEVNLTPAAELALNEYLTDLRQEILWRATRRASAYGPTDEVSVRDVVQATEEVPAVVPQPTRRSYALLILRTYIFVGALLVVGGLFLIASPDLAALDTQSALGLALGVSGAFVSAFAFLYSQRLTRLRFLGGKVHYVENDGVADQPQVMILLRLYAAVELALRDAVAGYAGESATRASLAQLIALAVDVDIMSEQEAETFRRVTRLRNELVHGSFDLPPTDLFEVVSQLTALSDRLHRVS